MTTSSIIIGSRGSQLALWQSRLVQSELRALYPELTVDINIIATQGDKNLTDPLSSIGDKGLFTREIEHALLRGEIDAAVHSLKDLPTVLPDGLILGAVMKRADVRDVFISNPAKNYTCFSDVPNGGTIATGSLRRKSQLRKWRKDLNIVEIRGNLNTRIAKLEASDWDGMVLASAGVTRLGWSDRITEYLSVDRMLPAVGQGAIGIEIRKNDDRVAAAIARMASYATTVSTTAERALLHALEGGCQIPIGAYGRIEDNVLHLDGMVGSLDGLHTVRATIQGSPEDAEEIGRELGSTLLGMGGRKILNDIRGGAGVAV